MADGVVAASATGFTFTVSCPNEIDLNAAARMARQNKNRY
jgi:hypothetical protein